MNIPRTSDCRLATHKGLTETLERVSFRLDGKTGPLPDGELARAQTWGAALGRRLTFVTLHPSS